MGGGEVAQTPSKGRAEEAEGGGEAGGGNVRSSSAEGVAGNL